MAINWKEVFDTSGVKIVTQNDKKKDAYVLNKAQLAVILAAGIKPQRGHEFEITVLCDPHNNFVKTSFYFSERSAQAGRAPEPRMGRELISTWMNSGDRILIGNIGEEIFVLKTAMTPDSSHELIDEVITRASKQALFSRARQATGKPSKREITREEFVRNVYVAAAVLRRADGKCEMPGCNRGLFVKEDRAPYLEAHHVTPLSENGDDTLTNSAALCPHCHREQHSGRNRMALRAILGDAVVAKMKKF